MRYKAGLAAVTAGLTLAVAAGSALALTALAAKPDAGAAPGGQVQMDPQSVAVAAADKAAASGLDALRKGAAEEFDRRAVYKGGSGQRELYYVSYDRTYQGMRVVGGDAVVVSDGQGKVVHTVSASSGDIKLSTRPSITAAQATAVARKQLSKVDSAAAPELVVLAIKQPKPILAWDVVVSGTSKGEPSRKHYYVNAANGKVAYSQEQIQAGTGTGVWGGANLSLPTSGSSGNYKMEDPTRGNLSCRDYSNGSTGAIRTDADDVWGSTSKTDKVSGCVDVFYTNAKQWDMLKDWFGRNGFNGQGGAWPSYVGLADRNAYWDYVPNATLYGYNSANQWLTAIDVVAHENGHGLDENTPGGTSSEAGLGEGTGDIWGALTEHYINSSVDTPDYQVGEMVNFSGNNKPLRIMYKPSDDGRSPDCWSTSIPNTEVHDAAGPLNHWFYLLAEGNSPSGKPASPSCTGGPTGLVGIGIQNAGKIFYNAMLLKTSGMTYNKYRIATLQAAKNLDSTCAQYNKVKAAWNAIALGTQSGEPTCTASGDDWSMALNPTSGSVQPGSSLTVTVNTTTTSGNAQNVALSATGAPSGVTVSFSPTSVSSGNSSTMTIATTSSAAAGNYTITVNGDGATDHTATYTLTVGNGNPNPPGIPDIDVAKVQAHLTQFGTIASNNGGNRRAGSAGYTASVNYLKQKLEAAGYTVTLQRCTSGCVYASDNVIADWPGGPADQVTMFGAHLDSVSAGPGINDNASGSATLLENALALATANPSSMTKHVRFAWWTDEEQGLNGSKFYVNQLSSTAKSAIKGYYNFDMVGSTNGGYFINNINTTVSKPLKDYWTSLNLSPEENTEGAGRSDDYSFSNAGIPSSGYATGASAKKTTAQQQKWGGTANAAYDPCYHASCDTTNNISATHLNRTADGVAYAIWTTSVGDTPPPTDDFSISLNPTSGTVNAGSSATATVNTSTTAGSAQTVNLSATGAGSGVTVSFNPTSVTSGNSSTMTISVAAGTPSGNHSIVVKGQGSVSHNATYTLTVNGTQPSPTPTPSTTTSPPSGRTFTNGTDYQILDNRIFSSVTSTATGSAVSPVKLSITINHTCSEDLGISLIAPNGQVYAVKYSGSGNYQCTPFGGTRLYNVPVAAAAAGTWQLRVTDYGPGDYGVLDTWSITL